MVNEANEGIGSSTEAHGEVVISHRFLGGATIDNVALRSSVKAASGKPAFLVNCTVSVLRYSGVTPLHTAFTATKFARVRTVVLNDVHDAELFPNSAFILDDQRPEAATAKMPGLADDSHHESNQERKPSPTQQQDGSLVLPNGDSLEDLAAATHFQEKHTHLVLDGSVIDMSRLLQCHTIESDCFGNLTGLERVIFPPNLQTIASGFMENVDSPKLELVFPASLREIGTEALCKSSVRSTDFGKCAELVALPRVSFCGSTFDAITFPPNLETIGSEFMYGANCPNAKLTFPSTLRDVDLRALKKCTLRSVNLAACRSLLTIPHSFLELTVVRENVELAPAFTAIEERALSHLTCGSFRFKPPVTLETVGSHVLEGACVVSADVSECPKLRSIGDTFMSGAAFETPASLTFPESLTSIGREFCADTTLEVLDMQKCVQLHTLPNKFLFGTQMAGKRDNSESATAPDFAAVNLPPRVQCYQDSCFANSKGIEVVRNAPQVPRLTVGNLFGADSDIAQIRWSKCSVTVGHSFCQNARTLSIADARVFHTVADDFCAGIQSLTVNFDKTALVEIGRGFLQGTTLSKTKTVDLSRGTFTVCPERFMSNARFGDADGTVCLPSSVSLIESRCCAQVGRLTSFSISSATVHVRLPIIEGRHVAGDNRFIRRPMPCGLP